MTQVLRHLLVTGGAGFIGSHFTRHALHASPTIRVTVLDALTYAGDRARLGDLERDGALAGRLTFVHGNVCDAALLRSLLAPGDGAPGDGAPAVDAIANFAAETHVDRSIADPTPFFRTNVEGTFTLLEALRALGAAAPRLLHVSTDEVYGDLGPDDAPFTESTTLKPSSPYSASKTSADGMVQAWARTYGVRAAITRPANTYGTHQYPEKLIPVAIRHALAGAPIPLYGDGAQRREWLHVRDHCDAQWTVLTADGWKHAVYNIPGEPDVSNREVAELILDAVGLPRSHTISVTDRPGHDRRYATDGSRMKAEFGWSPKLRLAEQLQEVVESERRRIS